MAIYRAERIAADVRIALDQNMNSDTLAGIGDVDTLSVDEIIRSKIVEGVKMVHCGAPVYLLDSGHNFGDAVYWGDKESGWVLLPEDFMRLIIFQMDDWARAVYTAELTDEVEYERMSSRHKGIRGTSQKPACYIGVRPEGRVLEFYSCKSEEAKVSKAVYLPYPYIDADGGINICQRCYDAVVYTVASLTLITFGDKDKSATINELAKSTLI